MSLQDPAADSTISDEELELEILPDTVDDPMVLKGEVDKKNQIIRQLTARAKTAEQEKRDAITKLAQMESTTITNPENKPYQINDEVVDLRLDGYSKEEVEWIMKNGGRKELENKDSYTAIAINARREQTRAEQAANIDDTIGLSDVERKYTPQQLAAMPLKELEQILPHAD